MRSQSAAALQEARRGGCASVAVSMITQAICPGARRTAAPATPGRRRDHGASMRATSGTPADHGVVPMNQSSTE